MLKTPYIQKLIDRVDRMDELLEKGICNVSYSKKGDPKITCKKKTLVKDIEEGMECIKLLMIFECLDSDGCPTRLLEQGYKLSMKFR